MNSPYNARSSPGKDQRPGRTVTQIITALRLGAATQRNLFFNTRREAFRWEESLLPRSGDSTKQKGKSKT